MTGLSKIFIKFSGICGLILPVVTLLFLLSSIKQVPWFDLIKYAISDLGRPEGAADFFNYGIILSGVLLLVFSLGLLRYLDDKAGPTTLGLSAIFFIGIGFFPVPDPNHTMLSSLFFIGFLLSFFIIGVSLYMRLSHFVSRMGVFALIIAGVSMCTPLFLLFYEGIAIPELLIVIPGFFWCMVMGFYMVVGRDTT